jgi:hypothetical protein
MEKTLNPSIISAISQMLFGHFCLFMSNLTTILKLVVLYAIVTHSIHHIGTMSAAAALTHVCQIINEL